MELNWNPIPYLGPIPINWYGITVSLGFLVGWWLVRRWAPSFKVSRGKIDSLMIWIVVGTLIGARLYFIVQNRPSDYLTEPWRILAVWEGGLAYFGGLFGAVLAAYLYVRRERLSFARVADLFAPAIPIGSAIGRISCGLAGMDYGTVTNLPWGIIYTNPNSYAPNDGVSRHPTPFYELLGDLVIAAILIRLRKKIPPGALFPTYLTLFAVLRFFLFFVRGDVPVVALSLRNAQWTALVILAVSLPMLVINIVRMRRNDNGEVFR